MPTHRQVLLAILKAIKYFFAVVSPLVAVVGMGAAQAENKVGNPLQTVVGYTIIAVALILWIVALWSLTEDRAKSE